MDNEKKYTAEPPKRALPPVPPPAQVKGPPFLLGPGIAFGMLLSASIGLKCAVIFLILSASQVPPMENNVQKGIWTCLQKCIPCRSAKNHITAKLTLDPNTAHPHLYVSDDLKSVKWGDREQNVTSSQVRFDVFPSVLSQESFTSGKICWEVEVLQGGNWWAVGVIRESVNRHGSIYFAPQAGYWAVQRIDGQYEAITDPKRTNLTLCQPLTRIRVSLDFSEGQIVFFDGDTDVELFTFPQITFYGEKIYAFFLVYQSNAELMLHP